MSFSLGVTDSMDMGLDDIISMRRKTAPKRTPVKKGKGKSFPTR
tara:strand:+ start:237 stop:368 length:132 start_codon:yes stop_codon:yes gene_type:complete